MHYINRLITLFLILCLAGPYNRFEIKIEKMLAPKGGNFVSAEWDYLFSTAPKAEQLAEHLIALAPTLETTHALETLALKLGTLPSTIMSDESKIDLLEKVLKEAPGNPLQSETYRFRRTNFFIPLILKEEAILLKDLALKAQKDELSLLDVGSGNGSILWLLRQLLRTINIPNHKVVVVEKNKAKLEQSKSLHTDTPNHFFLNEEMLSFDWLEAYQEKMEQDESFPMVFDAIIFQHSLHEIYSTVFHQNKNKAEQQKKAMDAVEDVLSIANALTHSESILHIHDGLLPEEANEKVTLVFHQDKSEIPWLEQAWFDFLQKKKELGLENEIVEPISNFSYRVSKRLYSHFMTKVWYLAHSKKEAEPEMDQIANFATFEQIATLIRENGFTPFFSLKLREYPHLDFVQKGITAIDEKKNTYNPWQFAGFLASRSKAEELPNYFIPTHLTYDGPPRTWFDSFEYRQERKKLEAEMFTGMHDVINKTATSVAGFTGIALRKEAQPYFTEKLLEKMQVFQTAISNFSKTLYYIQIKEKEEEPLTVSERASLIESNLFWKIKLTSLATEIINWFEGKQIDLAILISFLELINFVPDELAEFNHYFETNGYEIDTKGWSHKDFFQWTVGAPEIRGWMKRHIHFQMGHPFTSMWKLDKNNLPFDIEIFRTLLYTLFFTAKENAIKPDFYKNIDSPFHIEVKKKKRDLIIQLDFYIESSKIDSIRKQKKILFAEKVAKHLGGKFIYQEVNSLASIAFIIPFKQDKDDEKNYLKKEEERYALFGIENLVGAAL